MAGNQSVTRTYDRIFAIVRDQVEPILFDNVSSKTKLLYRMKQAGAIVKVGGRPHLRFNIVKELPTTLGYTDLDTITPVRADPVTSVIYEWKQLETPIQVSGLDMIKTGSGNEVDLLELFIQSAEVSMRDALGGSTYGIFSDGTESTLGKITGLQTALTSSTSTGSLGGLSRATLSSWRHQSENVSSDFSANGLSAMRTLYRECSRFDESPDTIVLTGAAMDNFEGAMTTTTSLNLPRESDQGMLDVGFWNIRYKGAVVFDDDGCPANYGYFLNLAKYVKLYVREGRDAEITDFIKSRDKDDLVAFILTACNMTYTNLARLGVLLSADTN